MATKPFAPFNEDALLRSTQAFPAANANADSDGWKIPHGSNSAPDPSLCVKITFPDLAAHSDTNDTITATLQDSADGVTYAAVNPLVQLSLVGVASTGTTGGDYILPLPPNVREYVRVRVNNPSGGPTITSSNWTAGVVVRAC